MAGSGSFGFAVMGGSGLDARLLLWGAVDVGDPFPSQPAGGEEYMLDTRIGTVSVNLALWRGGSRCSASVVVINCTRAFGGGDDVGRVVL